MQKEMQQVRGLCAGPHIQHRCYGKSAKAKQLLRFLFPSQMSRISGDEAWQGDALCAKNRAVFNKHTLHSDVLTWLSIAAYALMEGSLTQAASTGCTAARDRAGMPQGNQGKKVFLA